jgi:hypothetical protein
VLLGLERNLLRRAHLVPTTVTELVSREMYQQIPLMKSTNRYHNRSLSNYIVQYVFCSAMVETEYFFPYFMYRVSYSVTY